MKRLVGWWVLYLSIPLAALAQVDTSYIYNTSMPYGTLDLRLAKSPTRYYYLQEGVTFSYRESAPGVKTNTYASMTTWNTSAYGQGHLREKNGTSDAFVMNYRLLKPKNYNESYSPGYPMIVMFHGAGESANCWIDRRCYWATSSYNPVTNSPPAPTTENHKLLNNDRNLLHGGAPHLSAVNLAGSMLPDDPNLPERAFPGFVLFPQSLNGWGPTHTVEDAIRIIRLLMKKYNIDENRIYVHGLSNGGIAVYQALKRAPWLFAAALPMSAPYEAGVINQGMVPEVTKVPLWIFQGGQDIAPTPQRTFGYVRTFREAGGNVRYSLYEHLGHGTWNTAYKEPDFFSWMLGKRKNNPQVLYGNPVICNTTQTGVRLGFAKGFFAYQWQRNGQIIAGATGPEYTADTPGTYRGRISRVPNPSDGDWEPWSDPIVVTEWYPEKPVVEVIGTAHLRGPGLPSTDANNTVRLRSADSAEWYVWYKDGSPVNFSGTDADDTLRTATFINAYSGGNGAYTLVTKNFNCPSPPSDPVNLFFNDSSPQNITLSADAINFRGMPDAASIFLTWNDVSGLESGYELWRRKAGTPDFQFVTRTHQDGISYLDRGVDPGTTYEYKLRAVNNNGRSNYVPSDDLNVNYTITTLGDSKTPLPPQDLEVVSNTLSSITLSWKAAKDESSIREYYVYYNSDSVSTGNNATTFTLTGLQQNRPFAIRVKAVDHGNHFSQASNQVIGTTYLTGLIYKHSTGTFESLDDSAVVASFASPEFTGTVPNFTLQPRTQDDYFNFQFTGYLNIETEGTYYFSITSDDGSRLLLDGTLVADNDGRHGTRTVTSEALYLTAGPHHIEVQYFDDVGGHNLTVKYKGPGVGDGVNFVAISDSALRSGTYIPPAPPAAPSDLSAAGAGMQRINLSWTFSDDGQTDYEVYRASSSAGPYEVIIRAKGTTAIDSIGLVPGTVYYYKVKTVNSNGSSDFSAMASASTTADGTTPTVPQGLTLISKTLTGAAVTWEPSTDNVGVTHYEIYANGELIGASDTHSFTINNLEPNAPYSITVTAVDASGNRSQASAALSVTTTTSAVFYSLATGNLNELSTWKRNANGTGESPQNFSDNGQYFILANRTTTALGGPWTVEGSSSRVIVPEGVTLTADHAFSARVELQGNAVLNLNHASPPMIVAASPVSTVNFNAVSSIPATTYGHVILSGTVSKTFEDGVITVLGNLSVHGGLAWKGSPHNGSAIRLFGDLALQGTRPETAPDNAIDLTFAGGSSQSVSTADNVYLYRVTTQPDQAVSVVNPSGSPVAIHLGSLKGGGLALGDGSILDINDHDLFLVEAAVVNPDQQTGRLAMRGGDLYVRSTASRDSWLHFDAAGNRVERLEIDLRGAGRAVVRSPLQVGEGIRVRSGNLVSESDIKLVATADRAAVIHEIGNGGKITGEVTVEQHLPALGNVHHYLSAPVEGVTVSEWQESFPISGAFSGASTAGEPSLFVYDKGAWAPYPPAGGSASAPIQRGVGYAALLRNEQAVMLSVTGNPFQGNVPITVSPGTEGPSGGGWTFVGNPFASPVKWSDETGAWTKSGISNVIAIRNNATVGGKLRSQVTYFDLSLGGGVVPAGTGFWVRSFTSSPALAVSEEAKVNPEEPDTVKSSTKHLIIHLRQGEVNDPAWIVFDGQATDGFDARFDGRKLKNYGMFNFATRVDTVLLAVNHVTDDYCSKTVNLYLGNVSPGSYTLTFSNISSLTDVGEIVLTDHYTGTATAVTGDDHPFSVTDDPASYGGTRFSLMFSKNKLDLAGPRVEVADVCAPGPGHITITASQAGVLYQVVNEQGTAISGEVEGNGAAIEVAFLPQSLSEGANRIKVLAGFAGCDRQPLTGELTVNLISGIELVTEENVSICQGADVTLEASGAPSGGFYRWFDSHGVLIEGATSSTLLVEDVTTETVYYVAAAHENGCESEMVEIHIYADTLEMPVILVEEDTLYTEVSGYYQWRKDGEDIPGATLPYYVPVDEGSYTVVASNGGCFKESEPYRIGDPDDPDDGDPVTGIEGHTNSEFNLRLYPVPSGGDFVNVLLTTPFVGPIRIEIVDVTGRLHFSETLDAEVLSQGFRVVPRTRLDNGIYIIRATQAGIVERKKLIVHD